MATVIIFDIFITVVLPFKYRTYITNKVAIGLVMGCWVIGFLLSSFLQNMRGNIQETDCVEPLHCLVEY